MKSKMMAILIALFLLAAGAAVMWSFLRGRAELQQESTREEAVKVPPRISRSAAGEIQISLDRETQARLGIQAEPLVEQAVQRELSAYGRLQEDPALTFTLRAPLPGTVCADQGRGWPALGEQILEGRQIGRLEPRVTPLEQLDLAGRLAAARAEQATIQAGLPALQAALDRARVLNADNKNVSDRALQEAESRARSEASRLAAAQETVRLLEAYAAAGDGPRRPLPLVIPQAGEVVELLVQPEEAVESGQPILRVVRFDHLIARVDLPAGEVVAGPPATARICAVGHEEHSIPGTRIALAPSGDPRTLGQGFLFRIANTDLQLRPGAAVMAYLPAAGQAETGWIVPRAAAVRDRGKSWAYLQIGDQQFSRFEIPLDYPVEKGWFVASGFHAGDRVVVAGAQLLLSEELKSQIQILEESEKK
jgi:hypothetical protein